jgi:PAS domain S-box-containing protein
MIGGFVAFPVWIATNRSFVTAPFISLGFIGTLFVIYALSRTRHYYSGFVLLVSVIFALVIIVLITPIGNINGRLTALNFLLIAVLLTSLLASIRATVLVTAASLILAVGCFFMPDVFFVVGFSIFVFMAVMSALIILYTGLHSRSSKQLADAEARYRGLYEQTHDAVFILDLQGKHLQANQRAAYFLNYPLNEILHLSVNDTSSEVAESQTILKRLLAGEHIPVYERVFRRKDGSTVTGEVNLELVRDSDGNPLHIQSVVRDIDQRKYSEERLHQQNKYLTVLYHVTLDLLNRRNRDDLLQSIINHVTDIIDAPYVEILLKEGDEMITRACSANVSFMLGDRANRHEASLVWKAYDTQQVATVDDYSTYSLRRPVYNQTPTSAVACFPILLGQECVGILDLSRIEKNRPFTPEEIQQGTLLAQLVALLLDNANLHDSAASEIAQRKQTEENLRTIQERQQALLNAIPDLMFRFNRDGIYLDYHARDMSLLVVPPEQFVGRKVRDVLPPEISNVHMQNLYNVLESGKESLYEYAITLNDKQHYFESRMVASGPDEVLTINRDITDRKQMEKRDSDFLQDMKALQEMFFILSQINDLPLLYSSIVRLTQQRLKIDRVALFLIDPVSGDLYGTYGVDTEGEIRDESYYREQITPNHWTLPIFNSPKHAVFWEKTPVYDNGIEVGSGWKTIAALWDGETAIGYLVTDNFIHHGLPRPYQDELSSLLGSTFGHVIRLKQTQITLHQSEERQRALLNAIPDLMFRFDREGIFLDYHSSDPNDLAIPPEQFMGRKINDVMPEEIAALHDYHLKHVLQTGKEAIYEYKLPHNGKPAYFESRMVLSGPNEIMTIIRDITERRELEEQSYALVMETARANVLGQFVQNASHELRTPLSTINTAIFLMTKTTDEAKRQSYADRATEHIRQLARLLDMILSMTKLDSMVSLDSQPINLDDWVRRVVNAAQERLAQKSLSIQFDPTLMTSISGDGIWLQEAFGSLLDNAIRFTPNGGKIAVRTFAHEQYAVVEFQDTGVGIPDEALPHIFERFWRQDEAHSTPGFGLGLSIALKIVEMHDGRIEVESETEKGSIFSVLLPMQSTNGNTPQRVL